MKKTTKAFQLDAYPNPVELGYYSDKKVWYPINYYLEPNQGEAFIRGEGCLKTVKWKKVTLDPCSNPYTAEQIKAVADEYGMLASFGMIQGWGRCNLFSDSSYGLDYTKYEVANMGTLGKLYDDYTDVVQRVGDSFVEGLLSNGFKLNGDIAKGWLWYGYIDEENYGKLIGQVGIYENHLHPLQHVDHCLGNVFFGGRTLPMFNPMSFDTMLEKLFYHKYFEKDDRLNDKKSRKMLDKIVSVHDRIEHLTGSKEIADNFHEVFKSQEKLVA